MVWRCTRFRGWAMSLTPECKHHQTVEIERLCDGSGIDGHAP